MNLKALVALAGVPLTQEVTPCYRNLSRCSFLAHYSVVTTANPQSSAYFVWFCMCLYICRYLPVSVFVCLHLPASVFIVCIYPYLSIISVCVGMFISVCLCLSVSRSLCLPLLHSLGLCLPACLSVFLSRQSIHLPVCLFCLLSGLPVRTSIHSDVYLLYMYILYIYYTWSIYLCVYLSMCISKYLRASTCLGMISVYFCIYIPAYYMRVYVRAHAAPSRSFGGEVLLKETRDQFSQKRM